MSLVVLRSWSDGPPKVRAIAPPDSADDLIYVPDHKGQFVAQEVSKKPEKVKHGAIVNDGRVENDAEADEHKTDNGSESRRNSHCSNIGNRNVIVKEGQHNDTNKIHSNPENNRSHNNTPVISGNKSTDGRYSSGATIVTLHLQDRQATESQTQRTRRFNEGRNLVFNTKLDRVVLRSTSASPDQDYIQEIESTPPSSPLSGRYRNLGPDLAACIPKRQLKFGSNWMKDDPSNIGIRWSHRRNLSNSTPSLSQDFYSSEEEKISSYSSQSSSKTPSPQPPASSSSSDYLESHRSHQQLNHKQHLPPQHHHSFQPKNELLLEEQEKEEFTKKPTQTIDIIAQVLPDNEQNTPVVSSQSSNHQEELSQSSTRFRRQKQTHLEIRPQQHPNNQNSNRGHSRRPRQRQLLSSPSTPPPPPPDQHDFYRMVTPPVTTPIASSSPTPSGIRTENEKDNDYDYNFSYLTNIKKRFEQRESEISYSENTTPKQSSLVSKSDVILVEVIRKQLKQTEDGDCSSSSSIQCQTSLSATTISTRSPNDLILDAHPESSVSSRSSQSPPIPKASGAHYETDKFENSSQTKSTGDKSESDRNNTNKSLSRGSVGFSSELKFECTAQNDNIITVPHGEETQICGSNEKLCDAAEPQAEKIYLTSTPQHVEQDNIPLIKSTTRTATTTTGVKAEIEESFQEISIDETSLAATVHTNNNTQEILEAKFKPVVVENEESIAKFSLLTSPKDTAAAHFAVRSDQQQKLREEGNIRSWSSDRNCSKKAVKTPQVRHQKCKKNETDDQKGQKEETEAGNLSSKQEPPPVDIAPGASSQCTDSNPTPQLEGPHFCLTSSYLNLDLVEDQANESERNDITVRRSSDGSIDRRRQDQEEDVPINLLQVNTDESNPSPSASASASASASTLLNLADSQDSSEGIQDVCWSHLILNCSKTTIRTTHEDEHHNKSSVDDGSEKSEPVVKVSRISMPLNSSIRADTVNRTEVSKLESEDKSSEIDVNVTNIIDSSKELKLKLEATQVPQTQVKQENRNEEGSENNNCEIVVGIHQQQHSSGAESDSDARSFHGEPKSKLKLKTEENIIMDRGNNVEGPSPIATVKIPVQAVNKHVRSDSGDEIDVDAIWRNSTVRDSFRGFCQELLESSSNGSTQDLSTNNSHVPESVSEKIIIHVPQPQSQPQSLLPSQGVNEGVIEFEDDEVENDDYRCSSDLSSSGGSDTHPIQQCNNSIEYISVLDNIQVHGAVNRIDCNLGKTGINSNGDHYNIHPKPTKWIISLDLGSHASGFSYWFHGEPNVVHIGSWSGDNCFHKIPSWILTVNDPHSNITKMSSSIEKLPESINSSSIKVGQDALDEYTEKRGLISSLTFVSQWREFFEHDSESARRLTFPYTLQSLDDVDFTQLVTALIHFFGLAAISQIQAKFGTVFDKGEPIEWLLTIPTCWNSKSRQGMREAARKSGAVKSSDGVNLIEDPMAASFFAAMCGEYENFLAVDVGGSFLHYSGFELQNGRMHQTVEARSLHLPTPELNFETLLTQIVSQEFILYYKAKYRPGWIELMKNFGKAKCKFDNCSFMHHSSAFVFVPSSFVIEFNCYTGMEIAECIQEQNTGIKWNDNGALCIPHNEMKMILKPTLDFVINKIDFVLDVHLFDNIVLTGGLARSKFLKESISQKFPELKLIMPKEFPNGVLQGATLSLMPNIQPKLVIKSPFSIGVGVMTPFDAVLHPEVKKIVKDGKAWCADVWDTLIKFDQEMELNSVINKRSYVGAQPGQSCLVLPLFKSCHSSIPNLVTDQSVVKCCELRFESTKTWQEIELILTCRASELIVMAVDRENVVHRVVIDFM